METCSHASPSGTAIPKSDPTAAPQRAESRRVVAASPSNRSKPARCCRPRRSRFRWSTTQPRISRTAMRRMGRPRVLRRCRGQRRAARRHQRDRQRQDMGRRCQPQRVRLQQFHGRPVGLLVGRLNGVKRHAGRDRHRWHGCLDRRLKERQSVSLRRGRQSPRAAVRLRPAVSI